MTVLFSADWAIRVGINPSLMPSVGVDGVHAIQTLTIWRFITDEVRGAWYRKVGEQVGYPARPPATIFWQELSNKKFGLFPATWDAEVDPIQAFRHPCCLSKHEFEAAYISIMDGQKPFNVVANDRWRVSTLLGGAAKWLGFAAAAAFVYPGLGTGLKVGSTMVGSALTVTQLVEGAEDSRGASRFTHQLPGLKRVYLDELRFRSMDN